MVDAELALNTSIVRAVFVSTAPVITPEGWARIDARGMPEDAAAPTEEPPATASHNFQMRIAIDKRDRLKAIKLDRSVAGIISDLVNRAYQSGINDWMREGSTKAGSAQIMSTPEYEEVAALIRGRAEDRASHIETLDALIDALRNLSYAPTVAAPPVAYQRRIVLAGEPVTDWHHEPAGCIGEDMKMPTVELRALGVVPMVLPCE